MPGYKFNIINFYKLLKAVYDIILTLNSPPFLFSFSSYFIFPSIFLFHFSSFPVMRHNSNMGKNMSAKERGNRWQREGKTGGAGQFITLNDDDQISHCWRRY